MKQTRKDGPPKGVLRKQGVATRLKKANLTKANLKDANLSRDNVGGSTQLQGANLTGAKISGANFEGAEYDHETLFPEDFDPNKHKMIFKAR
jgi:uncharacterized protein YjbI with pentapeptide repeats